MKTKVSLGHWPTFWLLFLLATTTLGRKAWPSFFVFISLSFGPTLLLGDKEQDTLHSFKLLSNEKLGLQRLKVADLKMLDFLLLFSGFTSNGFLDVDIR